MDRRTALLALAGASVLPFAPSASAESAPLGLGQHRLLVLEGGKFAIQTSRLALERSRNAAVRRFAELEIAEQTAIAVSLGSRPGTTPLRPDHAAMVQQLASLSGSRFDAMYVRGQVLGHEELLTINTSFLQSGGGVAVSTAVANVAVPSIQTHLVLLGGLRGRARG